MFFDYVCNNGLDIEKLREGADGHERAVAKYRKMKATIYKVILKIEPKRIKTQKELKKLKNGESSDVHPSRPNNQFKKNAKRKV